MALSLFEEGPRGPRQGAKGSCGTPAVPRDPLSYQPCGIAFIAGTSGCDPKSIIEGMWCATTICQTNIAEGWLKLWVKLRPLIGILSQNTEKVPQFGPSL